MDKELNREDIAGEAFTAFNELSELQFRTWKQMADIQVDFANLWQEYLTSCFQRVPKARNMSDLVAIESGLAAEFGDRFTQCSKEAIDTITNVQQQLMSCLDQEKLINPLFSATRDIWQQSEEVAKEGKTSNRRRAKEAG